jgi:hypothetical protein
VSEERRHRSPVNRLVQERRAYVLTVADVSALHTIDEPTPIEGGATPRP